MKIFRSYARCTDMEPKRNASKPWVAFEVVENFLDRIAAGISV